ncbi:ClpP/crotonase [Glonium stellatum]|uniref:ClpP/crotonase n=1 Tax=Glonium stellatum TaxID=574774 RepID=A0A8E2JUR7_9PEZI|nr:ClpP/crotonase [Glonium stellatum]
MSTNKYTDIIFEITGKIGIVKFNRPKSLNAFGGNLILDTIAALRELDQHPETVFTVLTGEGRFFSAGADVKAEGRTGTAQYKNDAEKKLAFLARFSPSEQLP